MWAAEPKLEERHKVGARVMVFLFVFAVIMYLAKRAVWARLKQREREPRRCLGFPSSRRLGYEGRSCNAPPLLLCLILARCALPALRRRRGAGAPKDMVVLTVSGTDRRRPIAGRSIQKRDSLLALQKIDFKTRLRLRPRHAARAAARDA